MTWFGPALDSDQQDVRSMVAGTVDRHAGDAALRAELAGNGIWLIGAPERSGGGGAPPGLAAVALERLGRTAPALAWASVQAQAAAPAVATVPQAADLMAGLQTAQAGVAVVDRAAGHVHLETARGRVQGRIDRIDPAHHRPAVLLLGTDGSGLLLLAAGVRVVQAWETTGLDGSQTAAVEIDAVVGRTAFEVPAVAEWAGVMLRRGATAIAAGIAGGAVDLAVDYARTRHQFGGPLADLPTVQGAVFEQIRRLVPVLSAVLAETGGPEQFVAVLGEACDLAIDAAATAVQILGGYGYLREYPAERMVRDAVSLRAAVLDRAAGVKAALATMAAEEAGMSRRS